MAFNWINGPQLPTPIIPPSIPSDAITYEAHVVANTVNAGGTLLYNTAARGFDVIYQVPSMNITTSTLDTVNAAFVNITSANIGNLNVSFANITSATIFSLNVASANLAILYSPLIITGTVSADPLVPLGIASKQYVDSLATTGATSANIGQISRFASLTLPSGWIRAIPQNVSRNVYANLFSAIGTRFGHGDGANTFGLPAAFESIENFRVLATTELPGPRTGHNVTQLSSTKFLLNCGFTASVTLPRYTASTYVGTLTGNRIVWVRTTDHPSGGYHIGTATLLGDGRVLTLGGYNPETPAILSQAHFATISGDTVTWNAGTILPDGRAGHVTTLLDDGRVLVNCGFGGSGFLTSTSYYGVISGTTITWTIAVGIPFTPGSLSAPAATILGDGRVLLTGGSDTLVNKTGIFFGTPDGANVNWLNGNVLAAGRSGHTLNLLSDDRVILAGGAMGVSGESAQTYIGVMSGTNVATFTIASDLPRATFGHTFTILTDGRHLLTGGTHITGSTRFYRRLQFGSLSVSDVTTWTPFYLYFHGTVRVGNNTPLIIGGYDGVSARAQTWFGTIATNAVTWVNATPLPAPRYAAMTTLLSDGRFLVVGGLSTVIQSNSYIGTANVIASTIDWVTSTSLPVSRYGATITLLEDNRVLLIGGNDSSTARTNTFLGIITANTITWTDSTPMPEARYHHATTRLLDGRVLVVGGFDPGVATKAETWLGRVVGNTIQWVASTSYPIVQAYHTMNTLPDGRVIVIAPTTRFGTVAGGSIKWGEGLPLRGNHIAHTTTLLEDERLLISHGSDGFELSDVYFGKLFLAGIKT